MIACATRARALPPTHTQTFSFSPSFARTACQSQRVDVSIIGPSSSRSFVFCVCVSSFRSLSLQRASPFFVWCSGCVRATVVVFWAARARSSCSPSAALACERDEQTQAYHRQEQLLEHARAPYGAGGWRPAAHVVSYLGLHGVSIARGN